LASPAKMRVRSSQQHTVRNNALNGATCVVANQGAKQIKSVIIYGNSLHGVR
jgi:predicted Zn-dependent protease